MIKVFHCTASQINYTDQKRTTKISVRESISSRPYMKTSLTLRVLLFDGTVPRRLRKPCSKAERSNSNSRKIVSCKFCSQYGFSFCYNPGEPSKGLSTIEAPIFRSIESLQWPPRSVSSYAKAQTQVNYTFKPKRKQPASFNDKGFETKDLDLIIMNELINGIRAALIIDPGELVYQISVDF